MYHALHFTDQRSPLISQTARVCDAKSGEAKAELRGHDHFVLVGVFAPISAYAAIKELTV
jgi:hypothetical protein